MRSFLTGFLGRAGERPFHRTAVGVVAATDATLVLDFVRADFSVTADFLKMNIIIDKTY